MLSRRYRINIGRAASKPSGIINLGPSGVISLASQQQMLPDPAVLETAYEKVVWCFRAVRSIYSSIGSVPLAVYNKRSKNPVPNHPALALLNEPNQFQTGNDIVESLIMWMNIREAFMWMQFPTDAKANIDGIYNKPPIGLYILPAYKIRPIVDPKFARITGYAMPQSPWLPGTPNASLGEPVRTFPAEQVIHVRMPNPRSDVRGLSPMAAAFQMADTDYAAEMSEAQFFERGMRLAGVLSVGEDMSEAEVLRMKADLRGQYAGIKNSYSVLVTGPEAHFVNLLASMKDMDFHNLRSFSRDGILASFGVPKILLIPEGANRSNAVVQERIFWNHTLLPQIRDVQAWLNRKFMPHFGNPNHEIRFDLDTVEALRHNEKDKADAVRAWVGGQVPIKTPNEGRASIGLAPLEGGDELYIPANLIPLSAAAKLVQYQADMEDAEGDEGDDTSLKEEPETDPTDSDLPKDTDPGDSDPKEEEDDKKKMLCLRRLLREQRQALRSRLRNGRLGLEDIFNLHRERRRGQRLLGNEGEALTQEVYDYFQEHWPETLEDTSLIDDLIVKMYDSMQAQLD